jgi:hypothetical protein
MAQVVKNTYVGSSAVYAWWRIALVGGLIGALYFVATILIGKYAIDPLFCGNSLNAIACSNSLVLSGNAASIVVGVIGLALLVWLKSSRPMIIVIASALAAWGLSGWTSGLSWQEAVSWSIVIYGLSYVLFSWLSRMTYVIPVLNWALAVIIIARILPRF